MIEIPPTPPLIALISSKPCPLRTNCIQIVFPPAPSLFYSSLLPHNLICYGCHLSLDSLPSPSPLSSLPSPLSSSYSSDQLCPVYQHQAYSAHWKGSQARVFLRVGTCPDWCETEYVFPETMFFFFPEQRRELALKKRPWALPSTLTGSLATLVCSSKENGKCNSVAIYLTEIFMTCHGILIL